jgi:predicted N-formylglutamate amidohydrolase
VVTPRSSVEDRFLVTCEHGGNRVPPRYAHLFDGWKRILKTHRGLDIGALAMAEDLAKSLGAPLVASRVTRLLVDLNRSLGHRDLHSDASRRASLAETEGILRDHYAPYRRRVEEWVDRATRDGRRVVHISSHSFTPRLHGEVRGADVGLLYDPARPGERRLCGAWKDAFRRVAPQLRVRRNYPYEGKNDGLTSYLRKRHPPRAYVGVELEINQALVALGGARWRRLRGTVVEALHAAVGAD